MKTIIVVFVLAGIVVWVVRERRRNARALSDLHASINAELAKLRKLFGGSDDAR